MAQEAKKEEPEMETRSRWRARKENQLHAGLRKPERV